MDISTLFQTVGGSIDNATQHILVDTISRMINTVKPWVLAGVTLYVMLYGYLVMMGMIREPAKEGLLKAGKILLIAALALNADTYLTWVVGSLQGLESSLSVAVTGQPGVTIYQTLDNTLSTGMDLVGKCITKALNTGWTELDAFFTWLGIAALVIIAYGMVVVAGGAIIVIATGLLKLVFAVGPFFIICLMFPVTAHLFEKWLGKAMTYIFQIVMIAFIMTVAVQVFDYALQGVDFTAAESPNAMQVSVGMVFLGGLLYLYAQHAARLAGEFGGGLAVEMMSAAGMAQAAMAPARTARNLINPTSSRLDPATGRHVHGSRLEHLAYGRSAVLNPSYRVGLMEQMARGWKPLPKPEVPPAKTAKSTAKTAKSTAV